MVIMVVGGRQTAGLSVAQTADLLGFSPHQKHLQPLQSVVPQKSRYLASRKASERITNRKKALECT